MYFLSFYNKGQQRYIIYCSYTVAPPVALSRKAIEGLFNKPFHHKTDERSHLIIHN